MSKAQGNKIYGIKMGPPAPSGWTGDDLRSWETGQPAQCEYEGGLLKKRCQRDAESGNGYCTKHQGKFF